MKRRHFLYSLGSLGVVPQPPPVDRIPSGERDRLRRIHNRIAHMTRHPASADEIAMVHLAEALNLPSTTELLTELVSKLGCPSCYLLDLSNAEFVKAINERIISDFAESKTINVDGWVMSDTEVLCCSLIASHHRSQESGIPVS